MKKGYFGKKSVFFRIALVMMIFFISVNGTMILFSVYLFSNILEKMNQERKNAMNLYMAHLDHTLDQTESVLFNLHNSYQVRQLRGKDGVESLAWNVAQNQLIMDYDEVLWLYEDLSGLFSYYDYGEESAFIIRSEKEEDQWNNLDWKLKITDYVRQQADQKKYAGTEWQVSWVNETPYLWILKKQNNCYYGAIMNLESLLRSWNIGENSEYYSYFRTGEGIVGEMNEKQGRNITIEISSEKADVILVQKIPLSSLYGQMPVMVAFLVVMGGFSMLAIPVIYWLIRRNIILPTNQLLDGIRHVEDGDFTYRVPESDGEPGKVNQNFNSMVSQISKLKIAAYEERIERQRIQMQYLTKQIQPHFILNTLNILYSYEPEEYLLIQKMILCLVKYFRYIVKVDQDYVPLYQELEHIRNYFKIQEARYPDFFYYYVEMDEKLEEAQIPPLLIQNFTENAIKYALHANEKIRIYVLVEKVKDGRMRIRIADTGKGMPRETLEAIRRFQKERKYCRELGIGIQNVIERLELIYHTEAKISIYNSVEGGATVDIMMPMFFPEKMQEENEDKKDGNGITGG